MQPIPSANRIGPGNAESPARAYDHTRRLFRWHPPEFAQQAAIDVEHKGNSVASALRYRYHLSNDELLLRWTATEVVAKVSGVPILSLVRSQGLSSTRFEWAQLPLPQFEGAQGVARGESSDPDHQVIWARNVDFGTHWGAIGFIQSADFDRRAIEEAEIIVERS